MADPDKRLRAVADAFLEHHGEPEDMHDEHVREMREAGALRHAELFLAMLEAATHPTKKKQED